MRRIDENRTNERTLLLWPLCGYFRHWHSVAILRMNYSLLFFIFRIVKWVIFAKAFRPNLEHFQRLCALEVTIESTMSVLKMLTFAIKLNKRSSPLWLVTSRIINQIECFCSIYRSKLCLFVVVLAVENLLPSQISRNILSFSQRDTISWTVHSIRLSRFIALVCVPIAFCYC